MLRAVTPQDEGTYVLVNTDISGGICYERAYLMHNGPEFSVIRLDGTEIQVHNSRVVSAV